MVKILLSLAFSFSVVPSFASQTTSDVYSVDQAAKIEILKNEVTLEDGRVFSNRLRVCGASGINPCRVYIIENNDLLSEVQDFVESVESGSNTSDVFRLTYQVDEQIAWVKFLTAISFN